MEDEIEIDDKTKVLLVACSLLVVLGVFFMIFWSAKDAPHAKDWILKDASQQAFDGKVDSVYRDTANHNAKTVILNNGYNYPIYADWEPDINLGDSISKAKGSFIVNVFKKNGGKVALDYRELVRLLK
jgi:hypothetical protein